MEPVNLLPALAVALPVGFAAAFLFVATGGAGLVTIPVLVFLGLPPSAAVATDLVGMLGGRLGGLAGLRREGFVDFSLALRLALLAAVGALAGTATLLALPAEAMRRALGVGLLAMLVVLLFRPEVGTTERGAPSPAARRIGASIFVFVGFWGTLIGAGFINIGSLVLLMVFRRSFLETAGILTIVGLAIGIVAVVIYAQAGLIHWPLALGLWLAKTSGAYLGAGFAVKLGDRWIRWMFAAVVGAGALGLLLR